MIEETKYELVKFIDNELELEVSVSPKEETVWLTQKQMATLFNVSVDNISLHIKNILKEELDKSVVEESSITASDGKKYKMKLYSLDVSIDPYSEPIWLTQSQMAILFGVDISRII